jgi:uncharacterized protein YciI
LGDGPLNAQSDPAVMLANSLKIRAYVVFGTRLDETRIADHLAEHIGWVMSLEKAGRVLLCGPLSPRAGSAGPNSMLVLRVDTSEEAERLARQDPLVREKVVTFEIREWTIYEGAIPVRISISDGSVRL